jgi:molybdate transport system substrate-binding protein
MLRRLLIFLLLVLPLRAAEVRVMAAASLTDVMQEIAAAYKRDHVVLQLGASNILARQIEAGAPADLFLSADERTMDALAAKKLIEPRTRVSVLSNTLVILGHRIRSPFQLAEARITSIALAEPSTVPAGVYARAYLQKLGIWDQVAPKVIPTENVRAALAAVDAGNADAAIVYKTDARMAKHAQVVYEVPRADGPKISYPFAVVANAEHRDAALRFLAYLRSSKARAIFTKYGFDVR